MARQLIRYNAIRRADSLDDQLAAAGGEVEMWKVGHSLIKAKMAEEKALLGGEMSGHIFLSLIHI